MKKTNVLFIIQGILLLILLALTGEGLKDNVLITTINVVILLFIACYGVFLYKKPHGNMLKYALLLFSANIVLSDSLYLYSSTELPTVTVALVVLQMVAAIIIAYCSGRLNRIDTNRFLFGFAALMLFAPAIVFSVQVIVEKISALYILKACYQSILFITLMIAYFARYKEHREAGLMDAPKQ